MRNGVMMNARQTMINTFTRINKEKCYKKRERSI